MRKEIVNLRTEQQLEWNDDTSRCPRIWPVGQQLQGNFLAYMSFLWDGLAPRALSYIELMSMFLKVPCLQTNIGTSWWTSYSFSRFLENKWPKYLPHDVSISLRNILKIHLYFMTFVSSIPLPYCYLWDKSKTQWYIFNCVSQIFFSWINNEQKKSDQYVYKYIYMYIIKCNIYKYIDIQYIQIYIQMQIYKMYFTIYNI